MYFVHHTDLFNNLLDFSTWINYKHIKLTYPKREFLPLKMSLPHFCNSNMILFV